MIFQSKRLSAPAYASATSLNRQGIPRFWVSVWRSFLPPEQSRSTLVKKIRYVDGFCDSIDLHWGSQRLDDAFSDLDLPILCDMLEGYFVSLQDERKLTAATEERWQTVLQFVIETSQRIARSKTTTARVQDLESRLAHLRFQAAHLHIGKRKRSERIRSLPANVLEFLYKTLDPECSANPFTRGNTRWRVWTLFIILLHQGLRCGEALILPIDAVRRNFDSRKRSNRFWMDVRFNEYEDDPRFSKPSIKNPQSLRQIPVSQPIALLVQEYSDNYRGRANHSFLFNSQKHLPLSKEGVEWLFRTLSATLPSSLQKEMRDLTDQTSITPHHLRHTCAVIRLNQLLIRGVDPDSALQQLRTFFGWSRESDMPLRYARAVFQDRLASVWNPEFDAHVDLIRSIPVNSQ